MKYELCNKVIQQVVELTNEKKEIFHEGDVLLVRDSMLILIGGSIPEPHITHWYDKLMFWKK